MKIACRLICQVTEKVGKKISTYPIDSYNASYYSNDKRYKVEYKLVIRRVTDEGDDAEVLKETSWFMKETNLKVEQIHSIHFANTTFEYFEQGDVIYIRRDTDIV